MGRASTLDLVDRAVAGTSPHRIVYVHGPGGVGKSAVLRAVERRATEAGRTVVHLDGRMLPPAPDAIEATLEAAGAGADGVVVIIDEVDELAPLRFELRRVLLATLAASSVVLLAGRRAPGREWFEAGLEEISTSVALRPLSPSESRELLGRYEVTDQADQAQLVTWSAGYPLALAVAASLRTEPDAGDPVPAATADEGASSELDDLLLQRLGGHELAGIDPDILDVACLAPAVDARMLAAALPGRSTRTGLTQLRALSISEPLGQRTTLHRLARTALRSRLRDTDPDRYRTIVLRIADHLRNRALTEDGSSVLELAELIENPEVRVGFTASTSHYGDRVRAGDLDQAAAATGAGGTEWFTRIRRWADESPQNVMTVRRATGELAAVAVVSPLDRLPSWSEDDIETGPVLRHARAAGRVGESVMMHDLIVLEDPTDAAANAEVIRVGNATAVNTWGKDAPRFIYVTATALREDDGTVPLGYAPVPELARADHERELVTIMTDFGPDGVVGGIYGIILMEQQVQPEATPPGTASLALVAALRAFNDDEALAASPLGSGTGEQRVASVRAEVRRAIDAAFGPSEADQLLRRAIERTYLDADGGHGIAQRELHMSRSSFYRHLQRARQQLADHAPAS